MDFITAESLVPMTDNDFEITPWSRELSYVAGLELTHI
jgi:hypothetical protein